MKFKYTLGPWYKVYHPELWNWSSPTVARRVTHKGGEQPRKDKNYGEVH